MRFTLNPGPVAGTLLASLLLLLPAESAGGQDVATPGGIDGPVPFVRIAEADRQRPTFAPEHRTTAPAAWLQEDPGDSIYRLARSELNRGRYREAARHFASLREAHPRSGYVADSYYYEAFALFRTERESAMRQALEILERQLTTHPDAATRGDAQALKVRIQGALARRGDASSFAGVADRARQSCEVEDESIRAAALSALINMDADRAVPILKEVLQARGACSAELRAQAVFLLSQKMTDETVDILLDLAHRNPDPDPEVRNQAVFWLSQVKRPEAVTALVSILGSATERELQEQALFALSQHRTPEASAALRRFAERSDVSPELRGNAIFWLGQAGSEEGSRYLRELWARADDPELKERIVHGLAQQKSPANQAWLMERVRDPNESVEVRASALFWAGQSGVAIPELRALFGSVSERRLKEQVLFALSQRDEPEAVDALMEIARNEQDPEFREAAVVWLGRSNDPRVADFLLELIRR